MKIKLDIEADAQEMRDFFGLPNVKPVLFKLIVYLVSVCRVGASVKIERVRFLIEYLL